MSIVQTNTPEIVKKVRKVSKKQVKLVVKTKKGEFFFPEELWRYIKQLANYGMRRRCHYYGKDWLSSTRRDLCMKTEETFCVPSYVLKFTEQKNVPNEITEFNPNCVELIRTDRWCCFWCLAETFDSHKMKMGLSSNDIITFRADRRKAEKKRATYVSPEKLMKDCYDNYYKDFVADWKQKAQDYFEDARERVQTHNEYVKLKALAKENKEQFIRDLAQMLCDGTIEYERYVKIVSQIIALNGELVFTQPNWREEILDNLK
jgi:hypothetical protein